MTIAPCGWLAFATLACQRLSSWPSKPRQAGAGFGFRGYGCETRSGALDRVRPKTPRPQNPTAPKPQDAKTPQNPKTPRRPKTQRPHNPKHPRTQNPKTQKIPNPFGLRIAFSQRHLGDLWHGYPKSLAKCRDLAAFAPRGRARLLGY